MSCHRYFTAAQEGFTSWRREKPKPQLRLEGRTKDPVGRSCGRIATEPGARRHTPARHSQVVGKHHPASWVRVTRVVRWTLLLGAQRLGQLQDLGPQLCLCRLMEKPKSARSNISRFSHNHPFTQPVFFQETNCQVGAFSRR